LSPDARLRDLPSVEEISLRMAELHPHLPRALVVAEVRAAIAEARREILAGGEPKFGIEGIDVYVTELLAQLQRPSLRRVINATGVVLHTNLGRAPLPHYLNLEYDLATGRRGRRDVHVGSLIQRVTGAPGIVVNNNAAAVFLVLHELAAGHEVIVSRGELIEIGDGFRIPDIMQRSGAALREVGTTNRTRIEDYAEAIGERTRLLLRVHPSNFHMSGFTARPDLADLAALGRERGIPVYEDLGSGCVADLKPFGVEEPLVGASIRAGASLVSFSGDKLLGGPQAGIIAGDAKLVQRIRRNPLFRALRVDKLVYAALETTLRNVLLERWDRIPALRMIAQSADEIRARAQRLLAKMEGVRADIIPGSSVIGGGSTPEQSIPTWLIALAPANANEAERRCREQDPPVIGRIEDDRLVFDLRTVLPEDEAEFAAAVCALAS
jgi:L-seryl-tRNA(Ser) seleniumtransferase